MKTLFIPASVCTLLLVACGPNQAPKPPKLFEPQRQALEKARAVDETVQQQAERQRQDVDGQTQ